LTGSAFFIRIVLTKINYFIALLSNYFGKMGEILCFAQSNNVGDCLQLAGSQIQEITIK